MKKLSLFGISCLFAFTMHAQQLQSHEQLTATGNVMTYLPAGLFLVMIIALYRWAKRDKLNLNDVLTEKNLPSNSAAVIGTPAPGAAPPAPADPPQSTSRLVLLLSGIAAVIIGVSFTCYQIYSLQYYNKPADWSGLTATLLSLGIGVVPYTVKQVFKN